MNSARQIAHVTLITYRKPYYLYEENLQSKKRQNEKRHFKLCPVDYSSLGVSFKADILRQFHMIIG